MPSPHRRHYSQDSSSSDDETHHRRDRARHEDERDTGMDHHKRSRKSRHSRSPSIDRKRHRHSRQRHDEDSSSQDDDRPSRPNSRYDGKDRRRPPQRDIEPVNPETFDYIVPYKQFYEYLRYTQPSKRFDDHDSRRRYDQYKDAFHAKQLASFFDTNKDKQWFLEKYHPVLSQPRKLELKQRRLRYFERFMNDLDQGQLDSVELEESKTYTINGQQDHADNKDGNAEEDVFENRLVIKTVLPTIPRENILKLCETMEGFDYLALSEPGPNRRFHRIGWINFKKGTDMQKAFNKLDKQVVDDFVFHLAMNRKNQEPLPRTPRLALEISNSDERLKHDLKQAYQVAKAMDSFLGIKGARKVADRAKMIKDASTHNHGDVDPSSDNDQENGDDGDDGGGGGGGGDGSSSIAHVKKKLDLLITYLRQVHMMCYYCGLECDSTEDLDRKCMEPHCRKSIDKNQQEPSSHATNEKGEIAWAKNLDSKLSLKYEKPRSRLLEKMGGKIIEDELEEFYTNNTQKEHSTKYRCKVDDCNKAFKSFDYVEKHINTKHSEKIEEIKENITYFNNYICDPNHLTPQINNHKNINTMNLLAMNSGMNMNMNMNMGLGMGMNMGMGLGMTGGNAAMNRSVSPSYPFVVFRPHPTSTPPMHATGQAPPSNMVMHHPGNNNPSQSYHRPSPTSTSLLDSMMPRDPRQVTSYVDLDAPTQSDNLDSMFY